MEFLATDTPQQKAFRAEVRTWLADHVPPVEGDRDTPANYARFRQLGRDLGARGWLRPTASREYGGGGLDVDSAIVIAEELDRYELRNPPYYDSGGWLGGASILVWGTEEQKQRFLPPIFRGDVVTWQLLTGPEAGSDLANTRTDAARDGDMYVLSGEKVFIGGSNGVDYLWTIARTDPAGARHRNLSWFMIPADLPGISITPVELLGDGGEGIGHGHKNTIYFDNVRVPATCLIGGENNGWSVASTHLELEHGGGGVIGGDPWFKRALRWAQGIERDGHPLIDDPEARDHLATIFVETEVARLLALRNFWMNRSHRPMTYEGPQSSYVRKMSGLAVSEALHALFGAQTVVDDPEWDFSGGTLDAQQRAAIVALHPGGTADVQKLIMARRIGIGRDVTEAAGTTLE